MGKVIVFFESLAGTGARWHLPGQNFAALVEDLCWDLLRGASKNLSAGSSCTCQPRFALAKLRLTVDIGTFVGATSVQLATVFRGPFMRSGNSCLILRKSKE